MNAEQGPGKGNGMRDLFSGFRIRALGTLAVAACIGLATTGCELVMHAYEPNPQPKAPLPIMPQADPPPVDIASLDGSLWPAHTNWNLFADDKAIKQGDTILVLISQKNEGIKNATTETKRESKISASIKRLFGFEDEIQKATTGDAELLNIESSSEFSGSGRTERKDDLTATVSAVVIDVLTNGNLVIYGNQVVQINNEASVLTVQGIVRPSDISPENTIESNRIANANIEFDGSGVVTDKQHPGLGMRVFDWVWPF